MKNGMKVSSVWRVAALGAVVLLALAGSAAAGQDAKEAAPLSGVQVHVDPATGQLRQPTPAEVKAFADAVRKAFASRMAQKSQAVRHGDGSMSLALGPESLNVWVATVRPDGSLHQTCVEGADNAAAVQGAPALEVK